MQNIDAKLDKLKKEYGHFLRTELLKAGVEHQEFSRNLGMKPPQISRYMNGKVLPSKSTRTKILKALQELKNND